MTAPLDTSFNLQGLAALKSEARAQSPAALKEAARQFESLFTQMLLKSMREASRSFGDSLFGSDQADLYQGMFDDQIALTLSKGRGLGLADMLMRQLAGTAVPQPAAPAAQPQAKEPAAAPGSAAPIATSKADFVRSLWPHAEQAARQIGVDPHALLAQAALETGWGRAVPSTGAGASSFNLFGIKAGAHWDGATASVPTLEFEDGVALRKVERFRAYASAADSFRDYAGLIRNNPRYQQALGTGTDIAAFAAALQEGGYATDPAYAHKITAVARELRALTGAEPFKLAGAPPLPGSGGVG